MILKEPPGSKRHRLPTWIWLVPILLAAGLILIWIFKKAMIDKSGQPIPLLYCDAEQVSDGYFINGGYFFANGHTQSKDYARSGQFSSKLAPGKEARFGLSFDWTDFEPGGRYEVSIWRRQFGASTGQLVVSGDGKAPIYFSTGDPVSSQPDDWEKLELQFQLPPGKVLDKINIHVYTTGPDSVYFDDLKLAKIAAANFQPFQTRRLYLHIGAGALRKLDQKRQQALQAGILETGSDDWVPAEFQEADEEPIPVDVRLKGDWLDHLRGEKWSFRIQAKSPYAWNRLTTFSLHTPAARYYLHEWLLHQLWEKEGVLTTRYDFAELFLNGRSLGIYAFEEHFEKQLVEYRQRREGPILKYSEAGFWAGIKRQLENHGFVRPGSGHTVMDWQNAPIEAFNEAELPGNPTLRDQFFLACERLDSFRTGAIPASQVFDLDQFARYFAISDLLQAYHGIAWHNQRFYANPITGRLEPIGFDGFAEQPETAYTFLGEGALHPQGPLSETFFSYLFQDPAFAEKYVACLAKYTAPGYLESTMDSLKGAWNARLAYLQQEFPSYQPDRRDMVEKARYIYSLIFPFDQYSLRAQSLEDKTGLQVHNAHLLPLEIVGYGDQPNAPAIFLDTPVILPAQSPRRLLTQLRSTGGQVMDWSRLRHLGEEARLQQGLPVFDTLRLQKQPAYLFFRVPGLPDFYHTSVKPTHHEVEAGLFNDGRNAPLQPHPAYVIRGKEITFLPKLHQLDTSLIIPAGYNVYLPAGAQLDLVQGAKCFFWSPVKAEGTETKPVRIFSSDGKGRGFAVFETTRSSYFIHTVFENLKAANGPGWQLTGAVTIYRSPVVFQNCKFQDMQAEDALNLIQSSFSVEGCVFQRTASDALDSDFSKGTVRQTLFSQTVNDGLDLSGSIVEIVDCRFNQNGDKGISIGEESDVTVVDCYIEGAPIAIACKDLSTAYIRGLSLKNCVQGFAAFQKKPEFGPGRLFVESYTATGIEKLYNIASGSSLQLGDQLITTFEPVSK